MVMRNLLVLFLGFFIGLSGIAQTEQEIACHYTVDGSILHHDTYHVSGDPVGGGILASLILDEYPIAWTTVDLYVVDNKSEQEWGENPELIDVRSIGAQSCSIQENPYQNLFYISDVMQLQSSTVFHPGMAYDLVFDMNSNGVLDDGDVIDGLSGDFGGMYYVGTFYSEEIGDMYVEVEYSDSYWHTFNVYYHPMIEQQEGQWPLVVFSHGWTHHYSYWDDLSRFLANCGYIVISHRNDVGDGEALATESASQTILENIDVFLENYHTIDGGILVGKLDENNIVLNGHSTGGEAVVRAYKRLYDGDYVSGNFSANDIKLVNSICPVAFLSELSTHPEGTNYHQFIGAADTDVSGWPSNNYFQHFSIYERGYGNKQVTYIHGAGHEDFHGMDVSNPYASGPDLIGKQATHDVMYTYMRSLLELYCFDNYAMAEYFTRNKNEFKPMSSYSNSTFVSGEFSQDVNHVIVIDDFQSSPSITDASSGVSVSGSVLYSEEILMRDTDNSLMFDESDWANGMTRARYTDNPKCKVIAWDGNHSVCYHLDGMDLEENDVLRFRSARLTRHPLNDEESTTFGVTLTDIEGNSSTVNTINYGPQMPNYPRSNGGYYQLCLEPGNYTIEIGGSNWEEEMSFSIPGYFISSPAGSYSFEINTSEDCEEVEVLFYDSYGDGWDQGVMTISGPDGVVFEETMTSGTSPDPGFGWQNEFYVYDINTKDFAWKNHDLDLTSIATICFEFGAEFGTPTGAIAIDDLVLAKSSNWGSTAEVIDTPFDQSNFEMYPNPANDQVIVNTRGFETLQLFDLSGRVVLEKEVNGAGLVGIDTGGLASGIYSVRLVKDVNSQIRLLMVSH